MSFSDDFPYVKTKVKFSGEFHRSKYLLTYNLDRRIRKEK